MTPTQWSLLTMVLSAVLTPILGASAALIGLARARKTVLVLAIVGLVLFPTAQIRRWRWFVGLLAALLVSAVAGLYNRCGKPPVFQAGDESAVP